MANDISSYDMPLLATKKYSNLCSHVHTHQAKKLFQIMSHRTSVKASVSIQHCLNLEFALSVFFSDDVRRFCPKLIRHGGKQLNSRTLSMRQFCAQHFALTCAQTDQAC